MSLNARRRTSLVRRRSQNHWRLPDWLSLHLPSKPLHHDPIAETQTARVMAKRYRDDVGPWRRHLQTTEYRPKGARLAKHPAGAVCYDVMLRSGLVDDVFAGFNMGRVARSRYRRSSRATRRVPKGFMVIGPEARAGSSSSLRVPRP